MTSLAIVSTSINREPPAYAQWSKMGELIVAGDLNTPVDLEKFLGNMGATYMSPKYQSDVFYDLSQSIGWRNIQRRNLAIMQAYTDGHEHILTVDDDNVPTGNPVRWAYQHKMALDPNHYIETTIGSKSGYLNPGVFCIPRFHGRGVPYGIDTDTPLVKVTHPSNPVKVVVSQAQVVGDPDCDAVERIVNKPDVTAIQADVIITPGTYCAFNSQATMWTREWAPVMAVLPGLGRYDDIFASFIFARLGREYGVAVHIGTPPVKQDRNEHDLHADLRAELWGMRNVFEFTRRLDEAHISRDMPIWQAYSELIEATVAVLPSSTIRFAAEWVRLWRERA